MTPHQLVDMLLALDPLAELPRTGWVLSGVTAPESVAAHSFGVALVAMAIVDALRLEGEEVDGEMVLRIALLHDVAEAATGDIPGPVKTPALKAALSSVEGQVLEQLLPDALAVTARRAGDGSREAEIVHAADTIQMLAKALCYERARRGHLDSFWRDEHTSSVPFIDDVHQALRSRREAILSP